MRTFWDRIRYKIMNQWIYKRDKNGNMILLYITGFPSSYYSNRYYPGYYCFVKKGTTFNYKSIRILNDPQKPETQKNMSVTSMQEILDCTELKDNDIKSKLKIYFPKRLLIV